MYREFPLCVESSNLSRDNLSMETGRKPSHRPLPQSKTYEDSKKGVKGTKLRDCQDELPFVFLRMHALVATVSGFHGSEPEKGARRKIIYSSSREAEGHTIRLPCPTVCGQWVIPCSNASVTFIVTGVAMRVQQRPRTQVQRSGAWPS